MWINREINQQIQEATDTRPCVLLTGARQTGKSSLLEKHFPEYSYVSLDLPNLASEAKENGGYFLEKNAPPIIIDEIQYAPELFRFLKIEIDKNRHEFGRYLITGSQKFSLMKGVNESLSGRISIFECHSLSIREIYNHSKLTYTTRQILQWMIQGGYPEIHAYNLKPERFYADYLVTYLERDVRQLVNIKDLSIFDKFLRLLALRSGHVLSMNSLASDVGVSSHTIKSWISILEASNIIYLLKPFYNNYGKRLIKSPKLYFLDTGLLCFLSGLHNTSTLENSSLLGSFFETLALGQLIRNFCNKGLAINLYYFRDNQGNEIDFIIPEGEKVNLYECKWKLQSGQPPKNISKIKSIFGENNVKMSKIITSSYTIEQIEKDCFVTNLIDL
ncbi:ATPase [hydrothermal vent metagenome]|uniref:ATPase n=1 Tax=hydrothermal vent metagenome TaxID=652676 RepID=A0A3B0Y684_9ZZZZ